MCTIEVSLLYHQQRRVSQVLKVSLLTEKSEGMDWRKVDTKFTMKRDRNWERVESCLFFCTLHVVIEPNFDN